MPVPADTASVSLIACCGAAVAPRIPLSDAHSYIDGSGLDFRPGLVDFHTNVFARSTNRECPGENCVRLDGLIFCSGVTTVADTGTSGWRSNGEFHDQVVSSGMGRHRGVEAGKYLRPGDIYTHSYLSAVPMFDSQGGVLPDLLEGRKRDLILQDSISADRHTGSLNAGMKDTRNVTSTLLHTDVPLHRVVAMRKWQPARELHREELGDLGVGSPSDFAVLYLENGDFGFVDAKLLRRNGGRKLIAEITSPHGQMVWDLNGWSSRDWTRATRWSGDC